MNIGIIIGNSSVKIAGFENNSIKKRFAISAQKEHTPDEIYLIFELFGLTHADDAIMASVVPSLSPIYEKVLRTKFGIDNPLRVSWSLNTGVSTEYKAPETMGEDRIANIVGAFHEFKKNIVVIDFGTATTVDIITEDGKHLGGIIAPGIKESLENLIQKTSKLFHVEIERPKSFLGRNTQECMVSGIYLLTVGFIESVKAAIKRETRKDFVFIATGGLAEKISSVAPAVDALDPDLGIKGLIHIYRLNR